MDRLLPNGSIVLLNGSKKRLMIYGRKQLIATEGQEINSVEKKMYDYVGVLYPEGYINQEYTFVFNHTDIIDIVHRGFEDEEEEEFQEILKEA